MMVALAEREKEVRCWDVGARTLLMLWSGALLVKGLIALCALVVWPFTGTGAGIGGCRAGAKNAVAVAGDGRSGVVVVVSAVIGVGAAAYRRCCWAVLYNAATAVVAGVAISCVAVVDSKGTGAAVAGAASGVTGDGSGIACRDTGLLSESRKLVEDAVNGADEFGVAVVLSVVILLAVVVVVVVGRLCCDC